MAKLVKMTGKKPGVMTIKMQDDIPVYAAINANIQMNEIGEYSWDALELPEYAINNIYQANESIKYKVLVVHILRAYYDDNDVTAIIANYMGDMENFKYKAEFEKLQECRKMAKTLANNIVNSGIF